MTRLQIFTAIEKKSWPGHFNSFQKDEILKLWDAGHTMQAMKMFAELLNNPLPPKTKTLL